MVTAAQLAGTFALGLATPLTAVCVIPLYPGFLAYLSGQAADARLSIGVLGALVAAGVLSFMLALGLLFTTVLQTSLTRVIGVVSPVAFAILWVFGLALIADRYPQRWLPTIQPPESRRPTLSAFGYGAFFGAIVLPCNPGFIGVFFARAFLFADPIASVANFVAFGIGMGAPLFGTAVLADPYRDRVLAVLTLHRRAINIGTGAVLVAVATYYLIVVFDVSAPLR